MEAKLEQAAPTTEPVKATPRPPDQGTQPQKAADPFADLETLEAEMARLLGRDKLN